jgi:hypothetical protein
MPYNREDKKKREKKVNQSSTWTNLLPITPARIEKVPDG